MATFLNIVNAVQRRLRAPETGTVATSDYSTMLGDLVNQAKREVEDAWTWQALEGSHSFNTVASTATYTLTAFNERARVRYVHNTTNNGAVLAAGREFLRRQQDFTANSDSQPSWYIINPQAGADMQIEFVPPPNAVYAMKVYGILPQDDLSADGDVLTVPALPVTLGAYLLALAERGDDAGLSEQRAQREYQSALSDAIALDAGNNHLGHASDWCVA